MVNLSQNILTTDEQCSIRCVPPALCGDIDDGEIYREWFLWQDSEVSQEWEAYDPITNYRVVASSREMLIFKIDKIEDERQV